MEGLLFILVALYLFSVLASWAMIKLVYDEVPAKVALYPVVNLLLPIVDARRTRGTPRHLGANATASQELDVAQVIQMPVVPGLHGPVYPPIRQREEVETRRND